MGGKRPSKSAVDAVADTVLVAGLALSVAVQPVGQEQPSKSALGSAAQPEVQDIGAESVPIPTTAISVAQPMVQEAPSESGLGAAAQPALQDTVAGSVLVDKSGFSDSAQPVVQEPPGNSAQPAEQDTLAGSVPVDASGLLVAAQPVVEQPSKSGLGLAAQLDVQDKVWLGRSVLRPHSGTPRRFEFGLAF